MKIKFNDAVLRKIADGMRKNSDKYELPRKSKDSKSNKK